MTATLNKATIIGTIVRDPEFFETRAGKKVAMFLVATEATWFDSSGARCTKSISHPIKVYDQAVVHIVEKFVRKGRNVFLEGSLEYRRFFSDDAREKQQVIEIALSGLNSRLIVLDGVPKDSSSTVRDELSSDDADAPPTPLSIKRSAKYADDTDTSGLQRYLSSDDQDRARLRAAGDDRRNA